ncbi:MAG: ATP-binding protein [Thermotogaceae bacterium]|nr:ATP-binding protein [Thermotogaceae bacterium]
MKAFTQIAKPHDDILEGRLTMDVFAADLWQVVNERAPMDYQDKDLFFRKTYPTKGMKNILEIAKNRLEGKNGDSVIQLQTPFGGGKTHTLIALYHKAKEWNINVVVFDGTALSPGEVKPWEELERQLTGKIEITKGVISPGKGKLIDLISKNSPVLILMDEVLVYTTKAAGIKVGDSNLASQTLAFMQEITGAVSAVENALLVITLPSSVLEHYDENAEKLFQQLHKITGRMEKIYTPVEEDEIEHVIRKRLFQGIDKSKAREVVNEFVEYAKNERLISGDEVGKYREKFLRSYPFKPEVIDVLYKRWGSFPTFQRTRGVLRLLSLLVHDLIDKNIPFIRLGDFNLNNDEIKRELIKHIGQEWDSIIAQDITSNDSGANKIDENLGISYRLYKLGTVISTTIFMLSFSGRGERESSSIKEIKFTSSHPDFSSTVIDTAISQLKERLFYISDEGLFFTNQPNLNRILLMREENITQDAIIEEEKSLIESKVSKSNFSIYIWPKYHKDIPDTRELKLVILKNTEPYKDFLEKHGENPRVYRNTLIFICVDGNQKERFYEFIKKILALKSIEGNKSLNLTDNQKKDIKSKIRSYEQRTYEELRKYYRKVFVPARRNFKEIDLGVPTFGESFIDSEIYNRLRSDGEILERLSPKVIKEKYLSNKDYVETKKLLEAFLKTPGEMRILSLDAFKYSIKEGVEKGIFGLGYLEDGSPKCNTFKRSVHQMGGSIYPELLDNEIIMKSELCVKDMPEAKEGIVDISSQGPIEETLKTKEEKAAFIEYGRINLKLNVPKGQMSNIVRIVNYLNESFNECKVKVEITAKDGKIKVADYENKIEETLKQANILVEEEYKE